MSVESWSIVGRVSVDIRSPVGRESNKLSTEYQLSVIYRSTVGGISVNCRVLIYQVSPMAFLFERLRH